MSMKLLHPTPNFTFLKSLYNRDYPFQKNLKTEFMEMKTIFCVLLNFKVFLSIKIMVRTFEIFTYYMISIINNHIFFLLEYS